LIPEFWIAFAFSLFTIYGCGPEAVLYGLILMLLGIPVYLSLHHSRKG
jgi:arginine:agmatine antiporter